MFRMLAGKLPLFCAVVVGWRFVHHVDCLLVLVPSS